MSKEYLLDTENPELLVTVAKALSNPIRLSMLKLLYYSSLSISEIATALAIPQSTAAIHVKCLEDAGLIATEALPGNHGIKKICRRTKDFINISLRGENHTDLDYSVSVSMPVGAFTDADIHATCGMCSAERVLKGEDCPSEFFSPERIEAELLWSAAGYVEYRFPIPEPYLGMTPKRILLSFEACSEAPNYNENWPSDLTLWINNEESLTWTCPGDFGSRQGRLSHDWWNRGATQFGILYSIEISTSGTFLNGEQKSNFNVFSAKIENGNNIHVRIGNKEDAIHKGGFNLFGKSFGDYEQDIVMTLVFDKLSN